MGDSNDFATAAPLPLTDHEPILTHEAAVAEIWRDVRKRAWTQPPIVHATDVVSSPLQDRKFLLSWLDASHMLRRLATRQGQKMQSSRHQSVGAIHGSEFNYRLDR
jgi:hypothetical protein